MPPVVTFLTKSPLVANYDLTSIDTVMSGAAPLGKELTIALKDCFPFVVNVGQGKVGSCLDSSLVSKNGHNNIIMIGLVKCPLRSKYKSFVLTRLSILSLLALVFRILW